MLTRIFLEVLCFEPNSLTSERFPARPNHKFHLLSVCNRIRYGYFAQITRKILFRNSLGENTHAESLLGPEKHSRNFIVYAAFSLLLFAIAIPGSIAQVTIMPMGDSITVGADYLTNSSGGYRDPLYHDLTAAGFKFTLVGIANTDSTAALTAASDAYHSGFGGWSIQDLNNNLSGSDAPIYGGDSNQGGYILTGGGGTGRSALTPDIILLEIGTNDLLHASQTINQDLLTLVSHIHVLTPNTTILIAGITPINSSGFTACINAYNSYIKNELVPSLSYTRFVDQNSAFRRRTGRLQSRHSKVPTELHIR